ncbi:DUF7916 family protein [Caproiciproducens sp. LBM24188]|nr:haloacid dehalogenase-like hydrolase [Clostridiales bacterium]
MAKRFIDCGASDFRNMNKYEILKSIAQSEGRVLACETIGAVQPMLGNLTNAELAAAMGADFLILNMFDVNDPFLWGMPPVEKGEIIRELKRLTGRIIGIELEPQDGSYPGAEDEDGERMADGRLATLQNAQKACAMGADLIVLTGSPAALAQNPAIIDSLREISKELGDRVILAAGKVHPSGMLKESGQKLITKDDIRLFADAGADLILLPAPGTVPGITMEYIRSLVEFAHNAGALTMTTVGTSQEGADPDTIRQIALMCKMTGTDIHHLGDTGYVGMALPENIMAYSIAIKGVRHTYRRMARSINR